MNEQYMNLDTLREAVDIAVKRVPWSDENIVVVMTIVSLYVPQLIDEVETLRARLAELEAVTPVTTPRYDKVYQDGIRALDEAE